MSNTAVTSAQSRGGISFTPEQVHAFRLRRHHLVDPKGVDLLTICGDLCGVQAQMMSAAHLQLWARNPAITPAIVREALWQKRSLVKTLLMRQTLHLVLAADFPLYLAAQKSTRVRAVLAVMARLKITNDEADSFSALILETLNAGPMPHTAIASAVRPKVSKRVRSWMDKVSSCVRLPLVEGSICYGPGEGNQATFVRTDHWLPAHRVIDEVQARAELLRRYLRAYGPATLRDFAYWCGISMTEARLVRPLLDAELMEQNGLMLLRADLAAMKMKPAHSASVHLLPYFDVYLLAHSLKDHLIDSRFYKHVFRNQGWISPVVLIDGKIAGVWAYELGRKDIQVSIELFTRAARGHRGAIRARAQSLADLFQRTLSFSFKT
ncbi:MAG TPA: winged helix DNA-binding domain-containing protein [Candidatus Angelobacter sp.]